MTAALRAIVLVALAGLSPCRGWNLTLVGVHPLSNPAFTTLLPASSSEESPALFVSQFTGNPFASDGIAVVPSVGLDFPSSGGNWSRDASPVELLTNITWPNTIHPADPTLAGEYSYLVAGGFLVPPKTVGAVHVVSFLDLHGSPKSAPVIDRFAKLTTDKGNALLDGWFYHMALSVDMDGDGLKDVLTARATKPLLGESQGEMIWLKRPNVADPLGPESTPWQEFSLYSGQFAPDVFFQLTDLNGDGLFEIVYTTYFSQGGGSFSFLHTGNNHSPGRWTNASSIERVTVDTTLGTMFGLQATDLNADGNVDFLVTNHVDNASLSGVYAYVPPADGDMTNTSKWTRHTLASGFETRVPGPGQASPGLASAVQPRATSSLSKPVVLVSGDGEEQFHLLQAASNSSSDWTYTRSVVFNCGGTSGAQSAADLDGDGIVEVILPCYDTNELVAFSFQ